MRRLILLSLVFVLVMLFGSGCLGFRPAKMFDGNVGLVEIKGAIIEPDAIVEDLEKARKDSDVKAVVVRVDSPGGSVGASEEIFRAIKKLDESKPVVASMGDVAASGGYLVSTAARKIYANEGTVTGSIGVRLEHVNARDLFEFAKLHPETLKSGKFKDVGSSIRPMTPEERAFLEGFLVELHGQFKKNVAESRKLDAEKVNILADGRVYTGAKAKELGLIDEIGGLLDAVKEAGNLAGIKKPEIKKMKKDKPWWYDIVAKNSASLFGALKQGVAGYKYFLYEWRP